MRGKEGGREGSCGSTPPLLYKLIAEVSCYLLCCVPLVTQNSLGMLWAGIPQRHEYQEAWGTLGVHLPDVPNVFIGLGSGISMVPPMLHLEKPRN